MPRPEDEEGARRRRANPQLGFGGLVHHATSVGRDHIAATVNTLVLAYTGARRCRP